MIAHSAARFVSQLAAYVSAAYVKSSWGHKDVFICERLAVATWFQWLHKG